MQSSSGVGNCINMLSLAKACLLSADMMLVTMRGEWAEFNPWQVAMGSKTRAALELMDVLVYRVDEGERRRRYRRRRARHRLQRRPGHRGAAVAAAHRREAVGEMIAASNDPRPRCRRAAIRLLLAERGDLLLVTGLGSTTV